MMHPFNQDPLSLTPTDAEAGQQKRYRYPYIDLLRAVAALLVLVYHVIELGAWKDFPVTGAALVFRIGWIGVDLFLVISGFVITLTAVAGFRREGAGFWRSYLKRRWWRIAPLYFATLLIFLLLVRPNILFGDSSTALAHVLSHLAFLHNLHPATHGSIDGPNWSVALEMQFYLLIALITPWLARRRPWQILLFFIAVSWIYRYTTTLIFIPGEANPHFQHVYSSQLLGTLDAFGMGITLALVILTLDEINPLGLFSPSWRNCVFWGGFAAAAFWLSMHIYWRHAIYWDNWWMISFWRTTLSLAMVGFVACTVTLPLKELRLFRPLAYLGTISYGIYLWHTPVLVTLLDFPWLRGSSLLAWTLVCTITLSIASWHFFEKGFLARGKTGTNSGTKS